MEGKRVRQEPETPALQKEKPHRKLRLQQDYQAEVDNSTVGERLQPRLVNTQSISANNYVRDWVMLEVGRCKVIGAESCYSLQQLPRPSPEAQTSAWPSP